MTKSFDLPAFKADIDWCRQQADEILSITAGCATTHGDPGGGLEWANRIASDIAVNLDLLLNKLGEVEQ